jgi:hypothetical protein
VQVTVLDTDEYNSSGEQFTFNIDQDDIDAQLSQTPKYEHVKINCDEDNGNGDECLTNPTGPDCDPDGDGLSNREEDAKGTDPNDPDSDGDSILDGADACPLTGPEVDQVDPDGNGCWTDPNPDPEYPADTCEIILDSECELYYPAGNDSFINVGNNFPYEFALAGNNSENIGTATFNIMDGNLELLANLDGVTNIFGSFGLIVIDDENNTAAFEEHCIVVDAGTIDYTIPGSFTYPILIRLKVEICPSN